MTGSARMEYERIDKSMEEIAIYFEEEDFDKIIEYMEETGAETMQEAVMEAIVRGRDYHCIAEEET